MRPLSRIQKIALGIGACGGVVVYIAYCVSPIKKAYLSWTTNYTPSAYGKWDENWDHRSPTSLIKRSRRDINNNLVENNMSIEELSKVKPVSTRHIFLIRHGQYINGKRDEERKLTELGRRQAEWTGERLSTLKIPFTGIIKSTMTRAQETGMIISKHLPSVPVEDCSLIEEGAPVPPEPPIGHWKPEYYQFFQDGARIEAAFRQYFHRADINQDKDSYTILVCHANVIRYFVCRALQFPPEAWLRMSLNHASITWISITPSGRVILRLLGDSGHMPPEGVTNT